METPKEKERRLIKEALQKPGVTKTLSEHQHQQIGLKLVGYKTLREYYQSDLWKAFRLECLRTTDQKCRCCSTNKNLQLHHKTYKFFGQRNDLEKNSLVLLCEEHHQMVHLLLNHKYADPDLYGTLEKATDYILETEGKLENFGIHSKGIILEYYRKRKPKTLQIPKTQNNIKETYLEKSIRLQKEFDIAWNKAPKIPSKRTEQRKRQKKRKQMRKLGLIP